MLLIRVLLLFYFTLVLLVCFEISMCPFIASSAAAMCSAGACAQPRDCPVKTLPEEANLWWLFRSAGRRASPTGLSRGVHPCVCQLLLLLHPPAMSCSGAEAATTLARRWPCRRERGDNAVV